MAITQATSLADFSTGIGTAGSVLKIDNADGQVGIGTTDPQGTLQVGIAITMDGTAGVITASSFSGSGGNLTFTGADISAATGTFTGNVSVGGTLTYEDVTNVDSVGVITAQSDVVIADKIIHLGDTNTAIRFPSNDTFTVETNGSERFRINSGGNVGIGTDNPGDKLDIQNNGASFINVKNNTNSGRLVLGSNTSANQIKSADSGNGARALQIFTGTTTTNGINIDTSGRVGLGTDSPGDFNASGDNFVVSGTGNVGMTLASLDSGSNTIYFADATTGTGEYIGFIEYIHSSNAMRFTTSASEAMRIDSSGKVGININDPGDYNSSGNELVLGNTGNNGGMTIVSGTGNNGHIFFADGTASGAENRGIIKYEHANDAMAFNTAESERLRIDSAGDMGLGVTPDNVGSMRTLHIKGPSGQGAAIRLQDNGDTPGSSDAQIYKNSAALYLRVDGTDPLRIYLNGADRAIINSNGNMGLGTDTPESYIGSGDNLVIAESGDAGITIATGTSDTGTINFADGTSGDARYRGRFEYNHSTDALDILTAATTQIRIHSGGGMSLGATATPTALSQATAIRLGTNTLSHHTITNLSTTTTDITAASGIGGLVFVQLYNTANGAQYVGLHQFRYGHLDTISETNNTGLTLNFSVSTNTLRLATASGTVSGSVITLQSST